MKKAEKAKFVVDKLEELYPVLPVFLTHSNPFTLLIAVLLSAQSTDKGVNKATPALFAVADSAFKMEKLSVEEIKHYIRTIGLNNAKSKNIYKLCRQLIERHQGEVPQTFEELEALAGVGHKTASVVMSQAFGVPSFPVDTHIHRLMHRWTLSNGKNVVQTEKDAKRLFPKDKWNKLHLQIIFFGREHCPARGHKALECPICSIIGRKDLF
ncbi:MAG: endonuclease III [Chitinophagales bacterium]